MYHILGADVINSSGYSMAVTHILLRQEETVLPITRSYVSCAPLIQPVATCCLLARDNGKYLIKFIKEIRNGFQKEESTAPITVSSCFSCADPESVFRRGPKDKCRGVRNIFSEILQSEFKKFEFSKGRPLQIRVRSAYASYLTPIFLFHSNAMLNANPLPPPPPAAPKQRGGQILDKLRMLLYKNFS